jgi:ribose 5-phosphate isomerase A
MDPDNSRFLALARRALEFVPDDAVVGLGSGRAAAAFIRVLGGAVQAGMRVRGVPTSNGSADLARSFGIPLTTLDAVETLDVVIDGADEVDPHLDLIKGLGGALVREKIVASAARRVVILVGEEKLVSVLGSRGVLPVEVVPFALTFCVRRLTRLSLAATPRRAGDELFVTDNGNHILDCKVSALADPAGLEQQLRAIPGVVGTGLFLGMADTVLIQRPGGIEAWNHPLTLPSPPPSGARE